MRSTLLQPRPVGSYSAEVRIELHVDGRVLYPTHTAPDYLRFREPHDIAPSHARLVLTVDGTPHETPVEILPYASPCARIPILIAE
jgi:hypothetical protein